MPDLTSIECATQTVAALRALWAAHSDFTGVQIDAPRLVDVPEPSSGSKRISISINELEVRETGSQSPKNWLIDASLSVYILVESPYPAADASGDPAAAVLGVLNPIAITLEKRLSIDLRALLHPSPATDLGNQFYEFNFVGYQAGVDDTGQRLQALGLFEYGLGFWIPEFFDQSASEDLETYDIDFKLYGGVGDVIFPDPPHAEEDNTI